MSSRSSKLKVGLLGMPDNVITRDILEYFSKHSPVQIDFVVYWNAGGKDNWRRLLKKIRTQGPLSALKRAAYALGGMRSAQSGSALSSIKSYFVPGHNSEQCRKVLAEEHVDVLLLATDAIIGSRVLRIPRLGTINAHPGWIPRFRGLGGVLYQLEAGFRPSISVHFVNEGIDTGPPILRHEFDVDGRLGLDAVMQTVLIKQRECMVEALGLIAQGLARPIDTFGEPSNMTRGMPLRRRRKLDEALRSAAIVPDASCSAALQAAKSAL